MPPGRSGNVGGSYYGLTLTPEEEALLYGDPAAAPPPPQGGGYATEPQGGNDVVYATDYADPNVGQYTIQDPAATAQPYQAQPTLPAPESAAYLPSPTPSSPTMDQRASNAYNPAGVLQDLYGPTPTQSGSTYIPPDQRNSAGLDNIQQAPELNQRSQSVGDIVGGFANDRITDFLNWATPSAGAQSAPASNGRNQRGQPRGGGGGAGAGQGAAPTGTGRGPRSRSAIMAGANASAPSSPTAASGRPRMNPALSQSSVPTGPRSRSQIMAGAGLTPPSPVTTPGTPATLPSSSSIGLGSATKPVAAALGTLGLGLGAYAVAPAVDPFLTNAGGFFQDQENQNNAERQQYLLNDAPNPGGGGQYYGPRPSYIPGASLPDGYRVPNIPFIPGSSIEQEDRDTYAALRDASNAAYIPGASLRKTYTIDPQTGEFVFDDIVSPRTRDPIDRGAGTGGSSSNATVQTVTQPTTSTPSTPRSTNEAFRNVNPNNRLADPSAVRSQMAGPTALEDNLQAFIVKGDVDPKTITFTEQFLNDNKESIANGKWLADGAAVTLGLVDPSKAGKVASPFDLVGVRQGTPLETSGTVTEFDPANDPNATTVTSTDTSNSTGGGKEWVDWGNSGGGGGRTWRSSRGGGGSWSSGGSGGGGFGSFGGDMAAALAFLGPDFMGGRFRDMMGGGSGGDMSWESFLEDMDGDGEFSASEIKAAKRKSKMRRTKGRRGSKGSVKTSSGASNLSANGAIRRDILERVEGMTPKQQKTKKNS